MNEIRKAKRQFQIQKWTKIIEDCRASGLTIVEYVTTHGLTREQYYYWLRIIRTEILNHRDAANQQKQQSPVITQQSQNTDNNVQFVQLTPVIPAQTTSYNVPDSQTAQPFHQEKVSVSYRGFTVEVTESTPKSLLLRTLALLKEVAP